MDNPKTPKFHTAFIITLLLALAIRIPGLLNDFWLDEIWALRWAQGVRNPLDIFTRIHFDTNHWLYTFFMYTYGHHAAWPVYRIPALLAGILTIPLAAWIATRKNGAFGSYTAFLLFSISFPFVFYSSEARGYAPLIFFTLTAFATLQEALKSKSHARLFSLLFAFSCTLGFLSHLTFLLPYISFLTWSTWVCFFHPHCARANPVGRADSTKPVSVNSVPSPRPVFDGFARMLSLHAAPCLFFGILYWVDIRHIRHGGGEALTPLLAWKNLCAWTCGFPENGITGWLVFTLIMVLCLLEIFRLRREKDSVWIFFLTILFCTPPLLVLMTQDAFATWHSRHFLVCAPFLLFLMIQWLCRCYAFSRIGKAVFGFVLLVMMTGNLIRLQQFTTKGRGHYAEAVRFMVEHTDGDRITVGSDHDFRNPMVLNYYIGFLPPEAMFFYGPGGFASGVMPDWFILHSSSAKYSPPSRLEPGPGILYSLEKHYPFFGPSGFHWALYRKQTACE